MRLVLADIELAGLQTVQDALAEVGVERMTVCDALGYADETLERAPRGRVSTSGARPALQCARRAILEIAVNEDYLERTIETIRRVAGIASDWTAGNALAPSAAICVLPLAEVIRLSDSIRGPEGVS